MKRTNSGVFPEFANRHAFLDKLVVSVRGKKKDRHGRAVRVEANDPIGGKSRNYARAERGVVDGSGNPYELRYGPMRLQTILPSSMLILRSHRAPVTAQEVVATIDACCRRGWTALLSQAELTFDVTGLSVEFFHQNIFTSARKIRMLRDQRGWQTLYVGGRTSPWQLDELRK